WKRGKGQRGAECCEQDQHDGEDKPLLAKARRQRRQQDLLLVQRSCRASGGHSCSRVARRAVLRDRGELQLLRPVAIAFSMSFISVCLSHGALPKAPT